MIDFFTVVLEKSIILGFFWWTTHLFAESMLVGIRLIKRVNRSHDIRQKHPPLIDLFLMVIGYFTITITLYDLFVLVGNIQK